MSFSIIIVNYNGKKWLSDCLISLLNQDYQDFEILLVDNKSTDDSVNFVKTTFPKVKIISNKDNKGFGHANNIATKSAKGDYFFFLNPDTKVKDTKFLSKLAVEVSLHGVDVAGARIFDFNNKPLDVDGELGIDFLGYPGRGTFPFYMDGCALIVKRECFTTLCGFDTEYFMYAEDIDFSWRARLYGYDVRVLYDLEIYHEGGGSSSPSNISFDKVYKIPVFRRYETEKNIQRTLLKNYSLFLLAFILPLYYVLLLAELIFHLSQRNVSMMHALIKSVFWNITNIKSTLTAHKIVQKHRILSDFELLKLMHPKINKLLTYKMLRKMEFV